MNVYMSVWACMCIYVYVHVCVCQACELLQAERGRVERLAQIVCEQRSQLDSCPEATKEPLQEQLARVSTHTNTHTSHTHMHRKILYVLACVIPLSHTDVRQAYKQEYSA